MILQRVRRLRRSGDLGWSLVELLVVMSLFAGIISVCYGVMIGVAKQTGDSMARNDDVQQARLALTQIDRQVRSGNVVMDPATETLPRSLRVYTQTDGVRRCVQWQVANETLRYRSWDPQWRTTGGVDDWRVVARNVVDDASAPTTFARVTASGGSQAQSVSVTLRLKSAASKGKATDLTTVLFGRNTIYGYPADECSSPPPA
jgi:type II secretory pathway pseudopilin PulG